MLVHASLSLVQFFCEPMDCSLLGSLVHGITQARIWRRLSFPPPGGLPEPEMEPASPAL